MENDGRFRMVVPILVVSRSGYDKDKEVIIADSFARRVGDNPRFLHTRSGILGRFATRVKTRNDRVQRPVTSGRATGFPFESIRFFVHRISARNSDFSLLVGERDRA